MPQLLTYIWLVSTSFFIPMSSIKSLGASISSHIWCLAYIFEKRTKYSNILMVKPELLMDYLKYLILASTWPEWLQAHRTVKNAASSGLISCDIKNLPRFLYLVHRFHTLQLLQISVSTFLGVLIELSFWSWAWKCCCRRIGLFLKSVHGFSYLQKDFSCWNNCHTDK